MAGLDSYRSMLVDVAGGITEPEAKDLAQYLDTCRADRLKICNGRELIQEMEKIKFVSKDNVDNLLDILKGKKIEEAAERVEEYKQSLSGEDKSRKATIATGEQKGATSERVDVAIFEEVSQKFATEFKQIERSLSVMEEELERIEADGSYQLEIAMGMLSTWWTSSGRDATYKILADALDKVDKQDLEEETLQYAESH